MENKSMKAEAQEKELRRLREEIGLNRREFAELFSHSKDTKALKGANEKAKANIVPAVNELIQIATNKMEYPDYDNKHKGKAKYGWYRYDTRFGIPVYDASGELTRYNIFQGFCQ